MARITTLAATMLCLGLAAAALRILPAESSTLGVPTLGSDGFFARMTESSVGLSLYSRHRVMLDCYNGLSRLAMKRKVIDDAQAEAYRRHCSDLAEQAAASAPLDSMPWFVIARIRSDTTDDAAFNAALHESYIRAPHEYWMAENRSSLAEFNYAKLDSTSRLDHEADLKVMAQTDPGRTWLAQNYIIDPDFKARIAPLVEQLPDADQRAFLNAVRRELK